MATIDRETNIVKLLDTSGRNEVFALRISMPTEDYRPLVVEPLVLEPPDNTNDPKGKRDKKYHKGA